MPIIARAQETLVDLTDGYSVILTSEAYTFLGTTKHAIAGTCSTEVVAMRGGDQIPCSVDISKATMPTGITLSKGNTSLLAPKIIITASTNFETPGDVILPVSISGTDIVINKQFSVSIAFTGATGPKGPQGVKGDTGATGAQGPKGADGVSPTVSVTKSGTKTTISITDKTGTHTQVVNDGTNGTPGAKGADGRTPYFHVKYSNDGGSTFTSNSGETVGTYIGTCTDYNLSDPTSVSSYKWARIKGDTGATGAQGPKGADGSQGVSVSKIVTYYKLQASSASAPASPASSTSGWSTTEPAFSAGSTNTLYTCEQSTYSNGSVVWGSVQKSSSYEAAKEAYNKSVTAQNTANSANNNANAIKNNIYVPNTTTINGGKIATGSIKAAQIDVDNLFAQTINATGSISGAEINTKRGSIGGWSLGSNIIYSGDANSGTSSGSVTLSTADFTRTIGGASRGGLRFAMGSNFGVDKNGVLYANAAVISGTIEADSGKIAGWRLDSDFIWKDYDDGTYIYRRMLCGSDNHDYLLVKKMLKSNNNIEEYPFWVHRDGALHAEDADITGSVTARYINIQDDINMYRNSYGVSDGPITMFRYVNSSQTQSGTGGYRDLYVGAGQLENLIFGNFAYNSTVVSASTISIGSTNILGVNDLSCYTIHCAAIANTGDIWTATLHASWLISEINGVPKFRVNPNDGIVETGSIIDMHGFGANIDAEDYNVRLSYNQYGDGRAFNVTGGNGGTETALVCCAPSGGRTIYFYANESTKGIYLQGGSVAGSAMHVTSKGPQWYGTVHNWSDIRLKKNVTDTEVTNALDVIDKLRVRSFDWKADDSHQKIGFIADEVEQVDKALTTGGGYDEQGNISAKSIDGFYLQGYEIKAIQELKSIVDKLSKENEELRALISKTA